MPMKKVIRRDYESFDWIPIRKWSTDTIMGPTLGLKIFCKICDEYIARQSAPSHIEKHVAQRKRQIAEDKKKAKEARVEAIARAREEKRRQLEIEKGA